MITHPDDLPSRYDDEPARDPRACDHCDEQATTWDAESGLWLCRTCRDGGCGRGGCETCRVVDAAYAAAGVR